MNASRKKRLDKEILSLSKVINALNNKNRLTLLGLIYLDSMRSFTDMANETKIDSNRLSYHLNVLINTKLIFKKNNKYALTNKGKKILRDIGFIEEIKELEMPRKKKTVKVRRKSKIIHPLKKPRS